MHRISLDKILNSYLKWSNSCIQSYSEIVILSWCPFWRLNNILEYEQQIDLLITFEDEQFQIHLSVACSTLIMRVSSIQIWRINCSKV
jgi:hypothetical protein